MTIDELKAQLSTLTRPQADEVLRGVRAMLEALPPSTESASDARQRAMLEAFVAGYEMGAQ
ncbi:hypothetical protein B5P43_31815 [Bacillus sp. SRB_336]|nr:hypothetical protein B5P43_31815 [Bacillus sp. SRB_336]